MIKNNHELLLWIATAHAQLVLTQLRFVGHWYRKIFDQLDSNAHIQSLYRIASQNRFELEYNVIGMVLSGVEFDVFIDQYRFVVQNNMQRGVSFVLQTSQLICCCFGLIVVIRLIGNRQNVFLIIRIMRRV